MSAPSVNPNKGAIASVARKATLCASPTYNEMARRGVPASPRLNRHTVQFSVEHDREAVQRAVGVTLASRPPGPYKGADAR